MDDSCSPDKASFCLQFDSSASLQTPSGPAQPVLNLYSLQAPSQALAGIHLEQD